MLESGLVSRVLVLNGEVRGLSAQIGMELFVGRSAQCAIPLAGTEISRQHARFYPDGEGFAVEDLGSRNGILVNGEKVERKKLAAGDEVQVGNYILVFDPPFSIPISPATSGERPVIVRKGGHEHEQLVASESQPEDFDTGHLAATMDFDGLLSAHRRLRVVYQIATLINQVLDLDEVLKRIVGLILDILKGDRCVILLARGKDLATAAVATTAEEGEEGTISISSAVLDRAWREGKAILSDDVQSDVRFDGSKSLKFDAIRSLVCAPLRVGQESLGIVYVDVREARTTYGQDDLRLLITIANQAAAAIHNARLYRQSVQENRVLRERVDSESRIVGKSQQIREVVQRIEKVGPTDVTVLIRGETGTGKELVARMVHDLSNRRSGPYVAVNCAAMAETLLESELFGHEKGAFTGAVKQKPGKFELADGGTLFLDEIGEMSPSTQSKLLRVLQERCFHRVGGTQVITADVRILSATNRDLEAMVKTGAFREDLFYRIAVVPIQIPPLRERDGDVQEMAVHFLDQFNAKIGKSIRGFDSEVMRALRAYRWPGNVRELRNLVERLVVLTDKDWIEVDDLPGSMTGQELKLGVAETINAGNLALPEIISEVERICIELALKKAGGKKVDAARILKISRPTLDKKIRDYSIVLTK